MHPTFAQTDFLIIKKNAVESTYFNNPQTLHNLSNRTPYLVEQDISSEADDTHKKPRKLKSISSKLYKPSLRTLNADAHSLASSFDTLFTNPSNISSFNFNFTNLETSLDTFDDSYEGLKSANDLIQSLNRNPILTSLGFNSPKPFTTVLSSFSPDFDENI